MKQRTLFGSCSRLVRSGLDSRSLRFNLALLLIALLAVGCSGERPELIISTDDGAGDATTPESVQPVTTAAPIELQASDCVTADAPALWQVVIEPVPAPTVACVKLANHQRVQFVNNSPDIVSFELAGLAVNIEPDSSFVTEPAGTFLQPGLTKLSSVPHPISGLWLAEPQENTVFGQPLGLNSLGPIAIGASPDDISVALGGAALTVDDGTCSVATIAGDPYSPRLTIENGSLVVIQVHTPGQLTRSEIGVGSSEGDILAAYGQQIESVPSADGDPNNKLLVFVPNDEADRQYRLVFEMENDVVVSLRNGLTDLALTRPGCPG